MIEHFGLVLSETKNGYYMTRENYARINSRSSFGHLNTPAKLNEKEKSTFFKKYKDLYCQFYSDEWCLQQQKLALENFDYNMLFLSSLKKIYFEKAITKFLKLNPGFKEVRDLKKYKKVPGYYLMILDQYKQAYVGTSSDIYQRVYKHWTKQKPFDRLIFGSIKSSRLSIDSFRPLDTTRLYVKIDLKTYSSENSYINCIPDKYLCNRTIGGFLEIGFTEAILNKKNRNLNK